MWSKEKRSLYSRDGLRYPSDLTADEGALVAALIPPARPGGRQREVEVRQVLNGILDVLETGCPWRHLPKDWPPRSTCHAYVQLWTWEGTLQRLQHDL